MKKQVDSVANLTQKWSQNHMKGFKHDYNNIIESSSTKKKLCHEFYSSYRRNCLSFFGNGNLLRSSSLVSCRILSLQAFWRVDTERREKIYHQNNNQVNFGVYIIGEEGEGIKCHKNKTKTKKCLLQTFRFIFPVILSTHYFALTWIFPRLISHGYTAKKY